MLRESGERVVIALSTSDCVRCKSDILNKKWARVRLSEEDEDRVQLACRTAQSICKQSWQMLLSRAVYPRVSKLPQFWIFISKKSDAVRRDGRRYYRRNIIFKGPSAASDENCAR